MQTVTTSVSGLRQATRSTAPSRTRANGNRLCVYNIAIQPSSTGSPLTGHFKSMKRGVLPLLSELVEIQAITSAFETIAGRSAMVGFAIAATAELLLPDSGVFGNWDSAEGFAILLAGMVTCSAVLAASSPRSLSDKLLEPVLASLTSQSRSAGAVTPKNVDAALDSAIESVFNIGFVRQFFPLDSESQLGSIMDTDTEFETDSEDISLY